MKKILVLTIVLLQNVLQLALAQDNLSGNWEGAIRISGVELKIIVYFFQEGDSLKANIDIPQQGAKSVPLQNIQYQAPHISFELAAGPGLATFKGKKEENKIEGSFSQSAYQGTFLLAKIDETTLQESKNLLPYREEEISFKNGENTLVGTLTIPKAAGKYPAIVLITGSGAQDRNSEILGFKPHEILADYLSRKDFAVLRYDDRGVGASTGKSVSESTTADFAQDVLLAVELLKQHPNIDAKHIGLYGHSEGGIVAPMAASQNPEIAFIILAAGTGVPGYQILNEQKKLISQAAGLSEQEIKAGKKLNEQIFKAIRTNQGWDKIEQQIMAALPPEMDEVQKKNYTKAQLDQLKSPWFRFFIDNDPRLFAEKVTCPVLLLFGELDLQVPPSQSQLALENAFKKGGNNNFTSYVFPKANHLFQEAQTGSPEEYALLKKTFVNGYLEYIHNWLSYVIK